MWVGPRYVFLSTYTLINLAGVAVLASASCAHHMLKGFGALRRVLSAYLIGLVVIPIAIFLALFLIWKSPYIAISTGLLLGNISAGIIQIGFCSKAVQINLKEFILRAYVQPIVAAVLGMAVALGIIGLTGLRSFEGRVAVAVLSVIILFGSFYFLIASPDERRQLKDLICMIRTKCLGFIRRVFPSMAGPDV
jgi:hypothetical protein